MEELFEISIQKIERINLNFRRYLFREIDWKNRLIGIKGARGTGKTTMLLQWLKTLNISAREAAYFSLDDLYFSKNNLLDTARTFYQNGGKILVLDEVHKYPSWAREIKNLYDRYDDLKIVFTGSSILEISKQEADLSRRALMYEMWGMSYREYLELVHQIKVPVLELEELLSGSDSVFRKIPKDFRPLVYFNEYLKNGYYPFFIDDPASYQQRLRQLCRVIVEYDMAELKGFDIRQAKKLLQLLYVIAQQVPFKPNITSLARKTEIHRNSINNYLYFLHEARLIHLLYADGISVATLQKPEKVYLNNTNLLYALSENKPSTGTIREVFFCNQLSAGNRVHHGKTADFIVNDRYHFEIGGKSKKPNQIKDLHTAWLVKDDLEYPIGRSLPLWLFGLLY